MADSGQNTSRDEKNRQIVAALRETFGRLTEQLRPETEPATIYHPGLQFEGAPGAPTSEGE